MSSLKIKYAVFLSMKGFLTTLIKKKYGYSSLTKGWFTLTQRNSMKKF